MVANATPATQLRNAYTKIDWCNIRRDAPNCFSDRKLQRNPEACATAAANINSTKIKTITTISAGGGFGNAMSIERMSSSPVETLYPWAKRVLIVLASKGSVIQRIPPLALSTSDWGVQPIPHKVKVCRLSSLGL